MREADVAVLLALANGHDQRHGIDDVKVQAWHSLFQQEAPDMTREWAVERINLHYARSTQMLMPAHLVSAWRAERARKMDRLAIQAGSGVPMPEWFRREILG
jgi:hypothetical protein